MRQMFREGMRECRLWAAAQRCVSGEIVGVAFVGEHTSNPGLNMWCIQWWSEETSMRGDMFAADGCPVVWNNFRWERDWRWEKAHKAEPPV